MPELTASYTSAVPENNLSCAQQIDFNGSRENDLKNLIAQLLSLKKQVNDHFTNILTLSQTGNDHDTVADEDAEEEEEEEEEEEDEGSSDIGSGRTSTTEPNGRVKRPKTN